MRKILVYLFLVFDLCPILRAELPTVTFSGVTYVLATVNVGKGGTITNEYIPLGENIESWTTLLAVRYWPEIKSAREAAALWMSVVRPHLIRDAVQYGAIGKKDDVIVEAWLAPPDKSYVEINLHRFVNEGGTAGVKAYQFAQRIAMPSGRGDVSPFVKLRDSRIAELAKIRLELHTEENDGGKQ